METEGERLWSAYFFLLFWTTDTFAMMIIWWLGWNWSKIKSSIDWHNPGISVVKKNCAAEQSTFKTQISNYYCTCYVFWSHVCLIFDPNFNVNFFFFFVLFLLLFHSFSPSISLYMFANRLLLFNLQVIFLWSFWQFSSFVCECSVAVWCQFKIARCDSVWFVGKPNDHRMSVSVSNPRIEIGAAKNLLSIHSLSGDFVFFCHLTLKLIRSMTYTTQECFPQTDLNSAKEAVREREREIERWLCSRENETHSELPSDLKVFIKYLAQIESLGFFRAGIMRRFPLQCA